MMKTLNVPLVNIGPRGLDTVLELEGARFSVDQANWPESFPYAPFCGGRIARTRDALLVDFRVSGLDLRVQNREDNGRQWEDSCVEFFVLDPDGSCYYNFEVNALGKVLACTGATREGREKRPAEEMEQILRFAQNHFTTEGVAPKDLQGIQAWRVAVVIPFRLIGVDPDKLPRTLRANFYKCGDKTAHPHFLSWNPIPTEKPDFHRPESFGELRLV